MVMGMNVGMGMDMKQMDGGMGMNPMGINSMGGGMNFPP
jgi:hypothetical protein